MAIHVVERPQRQPPALRAVLAVGEQAVIAEEYVNGLAIGDRTGRRRRVGRLILLMARARSFPPPYNFAAAAADRQRVQLAALIDHFVVCRPDVVESFRGGEG